MQKIGVLLALSGIFLGTFLGSNVVTFIDVPAIAFVVFVGCGILIAAHGFEQVRRFLMAACWKAEPIEQNRQVAETGVTAFVAAGWIGTLVGVVQMLSSLNDPSQLGMGAAVALLTAFYGYILAYAICFPITRSRPA